MVEFYQQHLHPGGGPAVEGLRLSPYGVVFSLTPMAAAERSGQLTDQRPTKYPCVAGKCERNTAVVQALDGTAVESKK